MKNIAEMIEHADKFTKSAKHHVASQQVIFYCGQAKRHRGMNSSTLYEKNLAIAIGYFSQLPE